MSFRLRVKQSILVPSRGFSGHAPFLFEETSLSSSSSFVCVYNCVPITQKDNLFLCLLVYASLSALFYWKTWRTHTRLQVFFFSFFSSHGWDSTTKSIDEGGSLLISCVCMNVVAEVYPPPPSTAYPSSGPYAAPPPPVGYPMKDGQPNPQNPPPVETKSRGDGFWKGWYVKTPHLHI